MNNWFQSDEFLEFCRALNFVEAFDCSVCRDDVIKGRMVGYIQKDGGKLKSFLSRRAILNGGPMLADDITDDEIDTLLNKCKKKLVGKAIYAESRNFLDYGRYRAAFERNGWQYEPHYNFHVDTSTIEIAEANLGKSRKRDIRTSLRDGATVNEAISLQEVKDLYSILKELYATKVKTPLFPFEFFQKVFESKWGKIFVVKYEGEVAGGTVCVCGDNVVYEWFACGNDGISKSVFPSTLATWAGIKYAAENGFERFDMMGAGSPGDGGYGVRDFKAKFGGELVEQGRFRIIINKALFMIGKLGVRLIKWGKI